MDFKLILSCNCNKVRPMFDDSHSGPHIDIQPYFVNKMVVYQCTTFGRISICVLLWLLVHGPIFV